MAAPRDPSISTLVDHAVDRLLQSAQVSTVLEVQLLRAENARLKADISAVQEADDVEITRLWGHIGASGVLWHVMSMLGWAAEPCKRFTWRCNCATSTLLCRGVGGQACTGMAGGTAGAAWPWRAAGNSRDQLRAWWAGNPCR
jgi:hypothetical protein